ncbi:MAG: hypothetical protein KDK39_17300 [Leptospiraceae bacterium]|nr:hypothetical protein [Leptospiraceae bacterium]
MRNSGITKPKSKAAIVMLQLLLLAMANQCVLFRDIAVNRNRIHVADYRMFQETPAWELAKAVWDADLAEIEEQVVQNKIPVDSWKHFGLFRHHIQHSIKKRIPMRKQVHV